MLKKHNKHAGETIDIIDEFEVIECGPCGFKHIIPLPTPEELQDFYRHKFYTSDKPLFFEHHRQDLEWWNLVYTERYEIFEDLLPQPRRRLLDVGSGPGFFLLRGKERGWGTLGIEPSAQAAAHSRELGVDVVEAFLTEDNTEEIGKFDVVHMNNVLEHIPDPADMLQMTKQLLNNSGLICVIVPNDYNPFQLALRKACDYKPWWVSPTHHINYFNFESLSALLESNGFEVFHKESTFPIDLFLLMGENYIDNDHLGRKCHSMRMTFEQNMARAGLSMVKRQLYQAMAANGLGREIIIYGKLKNS